MIIRGGENITPSEIESVINEDPRIIKVKAISVPDRHFMEEICLCYISSEVIPEEEIRILAQSKFPRYITPRYMLRFDAFPKTTTEKVDKKMLRLMAMDRLEMGKGL